MKKAATESFGFSTFKRGCLSPLCGVARGKRQEKRGKRKEKRGERSKDSTRLESILIFGAAVALAVIL